MLAVACKAGHVLTPPARLPSLPSPAELEGGEGAAGGVYRPPKLNPVSMEDVEVEEGRRFVRDRRAVQQAARKAARSELVRGGGGRGRQEGGGRMIGRMGKRWAEAGLCS